jgi:hypothetical protein
MKPAAKKRDFSTAILCTLWVGLLENDLIVQIVLYSLLRNKIMFPGNDPFWCIRA